MSEDVACLSDAKRALDEIKENLKCRVCSLTKSHEKVVFFYSCSHFMCEDCLSNHKYCEQCRDRSDFPRNLKDDLDVQNYYIKVKALRLPTKELLMGIVQRYSTRLKTSHNDEEAEGIPSQSKGDPKKELNSPNPGIESEFMKVSSENMTLWEQIEDTTRNHTLQTPGKKKSTRKKLSLQVKNERPLRKNKSVLEKITSASPRKVRSSESKALLEPQQSTPTKYLERAFVRKNIHSENKELELFGKESEYMKVSLENMTLEEQIEDTTHNHTLQTPGKRKSARKKLSLQVKSERSSENKALLEPQQSTPTKYPKRAYVRKSKHSESKESELQGNIGKQDSKRISSSLKRTRSSSESSKKNLNTSPPRKFNSLDKNLQGSTTKQKSPGVLKRASSLEVNITKKNSKGESLLHLACKKNDIDEVRKLVKAGADVNATDNAKWTPLHDAIDSGNVTIIEYLLGNGANVNAAGLKNDSPLLCAMYQHNQTLVHVLLSFGADVHQKNLSGETPFAVAKQFGITIDSVSKTIIDQKLMKLPRRDFYDKVAWPYKLSKDELNSVEELCTQFNFQIATDLSPTQNITHIVCGTNGSLKLNWELFWFVSLGVWVVSYDWVEECLKTGSLVSPIDFEIKGPLDGFMKARRDRIVQKPGLFSGCYFYFGGRVEKYTSYINFSSDNMIALIQKHEGKILKRCPNPESQNTEETVPFHADSDSGLLDCTTYIIYQPEYWNPQIKYNMKHIKTLHIDWLVACMVFHSLIMPDKFTELSHYLTDIFIS